MPIGQQPDYPNSFINDNRNKDFATQRSISENYRNPQSNGFTKNYAVFFGMNKQHISQDISQAAKDHVSQITSQKTLNTGGYRKLNRKSTNDQYRINTGQRNDPEFSQNLNKFFGHSTSEDQQYQKNYKNFFKNDGNALRSSFTFKSNLAQNATNIIGDHIKPQSIDQTHPEYKKDLKRFFGLPPSTHQRRESSSKYITQKLSMIPEQKEVLDQAFENNKAAFFAGCTPDPAKRNQPKKFEEYINKNNNSTNDNNNSRKVESSASSYIASKNKFFGLKDNGNSIDKNTKAFFGNSNKQAEIKRVEDSQSMVIQRPKELNNFYYQRNTMRSLAKESYDAPRGLHYNIITGFVTQKE